MNAMPEFELPPPDPEEEEEWMSHKYAGPPAPRIDNSDLVKRKVVMDGKEYLEAWERQREAEDYRERQRQGLER